MTVNYYNRYCQKSINAIMTIIVFYIFGGLLSVQTLVLQQWGKGLAGKYGLKSSVRKYWWV